MDFVDPHRSLDHRLALRQWFRPTLASATSLGPRGSALLLVRECHRGPGNSRCCAASCQPFRRPVPAIACRPGRDGCADDSSCLGIDHVPRKCGGVCPLDFRRIDDPNLPRRCNFDRVCSAVDVVVRPRADGRFRAAGVPGHGIPGAVPANQAVEAMVQADDHRALPYPQVATMLQSRVISAEPRDRTSEDQRCTPDRPCLSAGIASSRVRLSASVTTRCGVATGPAVSLSQLVSTSVASRRPGSSTSCSASGCVRYREGPWFCR